MNKYIGVKVIEARPMNLLEAEEYLQRKIKDADQDGYLVKYADGYESWSPKEIFEEAYRKTDGLTFGLAIEAIKKGSSVARKGWNGKDMFLYLVSGSELSTSLKYGYGEYLGEPRTLDFIMMKTADNKLVPWLASQTDVLAEDWEIID